MHDQRRVPDGNSNGDYPPFGISDTLKDFPDWIRRGCGDKRYYCPEKKATFAPDGITPDKMPDFSNHKSYMAKILRENPGMWESLKNRKTSTGVTLAECIKTGVDNLSHPHVLNTVGIVAGDEESYEVFKDLFDPIISYKHGGYSSSAIQPSNLDYNKLSDTDIDPEGKYVLTTRVRTGRSIKGFKLPPCISFEDRRKLEKVIVGALLQMEGDLKGEYFPLRGSRSWAEKPNGMSIEKEEELRKCGNLFQEPDSTLLLSSGMARHWPDARGIFHNQGKNLFIWVGEEDHMRIVSMQGDLSKPTYEGKQIKEVTARFMRACDAVQKVLKDNGYDFMHNDHLGWILTCPSNLGTGMRCGTMVKLPNLSSRKDFKQLLVTMRLQARGTGGVDSASTGGTWDISNVDRIGKGEIDYVNILIEGAAQCVRWESLYDKGLGSQAEREIDCQFQSFEGENSGANLDYPPHGLSGTLKNFPDWIRRGCGNKRYYCPEKKATFSPDGITPDIMPDFSKHKSYMALVFRKDPDMWNRLKNKKTSTGVTLADCIKTGVDNLSHPHVLNTVGMVAGDEESYEVFKELFDPVISFKHGGYAPNAVQPSNLDFDQLLDTDIDPELRYVLTTRVRTGRSIKGFQLPPCISFEDRRKLEKLIVGALLQMKGDLRGDYYPLRGSRSWAAKPNGMSIEKEEELRKCGNIFQEPDSTLLLSSGMARHWPDARGIFHNKAKNLFIWVGEEDHMRIVSMQGDLSKPTHEGKQIKEVTARFMRACDAVQKVLRQNGHDFMHSKHLGWILTCPSNLGTGMRCGTMVKLPILSSRKDFKQLLVTMRLQARGTGGVDSASKGGTWDISNVDRIGKGEIDYVNILIEGAARCVRWESMYDRGFKSQADQEIEQQLALANK